MGYLDSLPDDTEIIDISCQRLNKLPDLSRFYNLKTLICSFNNLTTLPELPNITELYCYNNKLITLPELPNVTKIYCFNNKLTTLPELPNINYLYCYNNKLTTLPELPNITELYCENNKLTTLPELKNVNILFCENNPIYDIIENDIQKLRKLNKFRLLYFSIKYKKQFMNWLWEFVRKPKIEEMYHPSNLLKFMNENKTNWEEELENW